MACGEVRDGGGERCGKVLKIEWGGLVNERGYVIIVSGLPWVEECLKLILVTPYPPACGAFEKCSPVY